MIRGWIGWRRYVLDHITRAARPDPPTISTGGRPMRAYPTDIATATNRIAAVTLRTCVSLVVFMTKLRSWKSPRPLRGRAGASAQRSWRLPGTELGHEYHETHASPQCHRRNPVCRGRNVGRVRAHRPAAGADRR